MSGKQLYEIYVENMQDYCTTDEIDSWDNLNIAVQQAWDRIGNRVVLKERIEKALEFAEDGIKAAIYQLKGEKR